MSLATAVIRPWKSRVIQPIAIAALGIWPNLFFWIPGVFSWPLAVITLVPAGWLVWRLATARAVVRADGSLEVRAVRRTYRFPPGKALVEVGESSTFFSFWPASCLRVVVEERELSFWSISDMSDQRVECWVETLRLAMTPAGTS